MLRTRSPVYSPCGFLPRLACVRHAASVRSEPGSNSPIEFIGASAPGLTPLQTSLKALRYPQSLLRGLLIRFSKTERLLHHSGRPTARPASRRGRASYRCPRFRVKGLEFRPRARPTLAGGASCNTAVRRCQEPSFTTSSPAANHRALGPIPRAAAARDRRGTPPCCRARRSLPGAPLSLRETRSAACAGTIRIRRP